MARVTREQKKLLKAIKKNPHDSKALTQLGWIHVEQHEYSEAKQRFNQAVESQSDLETTAGARYGLALLARKSGDNAEAKDLLLESLAFAEQSNEKSKLIRVNFEWLAVA